MADDAIVAEAPTFLQVGDADMLWNIIAGTLILLMQLGFGLLEAGSIRSKNVANIFFKNLSDLAIGAIAWFGVGYAFAGLAGVTENAFIGFNPGSFFHVEFGQFATWFFQYSFCATAATIVSGALAGRTRIEAYIIFVLIMCSIIYPIVVHWAWTGAGFLSVLGYADFAGSGVVHMVGGIAALVAAIFVGPREGRFKTGFCNSCLNIDHYPEDDNEEHTFEGHSIPFQVMGTIVLFVGWLGFNPGSTGAVHESMEIAALCAVNTVLGASGGLIATTTIGLIRTGSFDVGLACNGLLAGLVGVTAGCNTLVPGIALAVGVGAGVVYYLASSTVEKLEIDDPLDAFAVHGASGFYGVFVLAILPIYAEDGIAYNGADAAEFFQNQFLPQIIGLAAIAAWTTVWSVLVFGAMHLTGSLRVSKEVERAGLDHHEHGSKAYEIAHNVEMAALNGNAEA